MRALLLAGVLVAAIAVAVVAHRPTAGDGTGYFAREYPEAWKRLVEVYGNASFTFEVTFYPYEGEPRPEFYRVATRWPAVRVDTLSPDGTVAASGVVSREARFRVERIGENGRFVLTRYRRNDMEKAMEHLWTVAWNDGYLPLLVIGFLGEPLVDYLLHSRLVKVDIVREGPEELNGRKTYYVEARIKPGPIEAAFWFMPDAGWVPARWNLPKDAGTQCEFSYGEQVGGVGMVQSLRMLRVRPGKARTRLEARMVSYKLEPPPEEEFRLAAFGLPEPAAGMPGSRLWLWTLTGLMGLLTALLLWRPVAKRAGAS
jgi:hypothetical protein